MELSYAACRGKRVWLTSKTSPSSEDASKNTFLEYVLLCLRRANLKLNLKKYKLFRKKVNYLSMYVVSSEAVAIDNEKIKTERDDLHL